MAFGLHTVIGLITVVIAVFALFYIFFTLNGIVNRCKIDPNSSVLCSQISGFTFPMILILLVIGGFILIISAVGYILLTS
ncbi:MAG: hypothetical protein QXQ18_02330 [Candidatus Aenigmatarchaeota archaeon]